MSYERLRVAKPMRRLLIAMELYTRHIEKEHRGQWREAKMLAYGCFGNLIRAAEEWDAGEKDKYLLAFLNDFAVFRGMMQILAEAKIITRKKASEIAEYTADIKKQIVGWRKDITRDSTSSRPSGESEIDNEKD